MWFARANYRSRQVDTKSMISETAQIFVYRLPQFLHAILVPSFLAVPLAAVLANFLEQKESGAYIIAEDGRLGFFLCLFVYFLILMPFAVSIIRAIFTERTSGPLGFTLGRREFRFLVTYLVLGFTGISIGVLIGLTIAGLDWIFGDGEGGVEGWIAALLFPMWIGGAYLLNYLFTRLLVGGVSVALDHPDSILEILFDTWILTKDVPLGGFFTTLVVAVVDYVFCWVILGIFNTFSSVTDGILIMLMGWNFAALFSVALFLCYFSVYHIRIGGWISYKP